MINLKNYISRDVENTIKGVLNSHKIIILYGARQVGKTTLVKNLFRKSREGRVLYLACDQKQVRVRIEPDAKILEKLISKYDTVVLDEAQNLENPGLVLKILADEFSDKRVIATGSSSFDLANKLSEPLTGRHYTFRLFPFSIKEIKQLVPKVSRQAVLEELLLYGSYPELYLLRDNSEKARYLTNLTDSYLYKDVLVFELVKNSRKVKELLIALSLQIGNEVSYTELGNTISMDRKTVEHYIDLLEKSFVLFRVYGYSRNKRSEINRKVKIYFFDNGVRNAIINTFNPLSLRNDSGALFENFAAAEMMKLEANKPTRANMYFWRTHQGRELDLIVEGRGVLQAYEVKWTRSRKNSLVPFKREYPEAYTAVINAQNIWMF